MKKRQKYVFAALIIAVILVIAALVIPKQLSKCTQHDRDISNCVPAGHCNPNPAIDALEDCKTFNFDRRYK